MKQDQICIFWTKELIKSHYCFCTSTTNAYCNSKIGWPQSWDVIPTISVHKLCTSIGICTIFPETGKTLLTGTKLEQQISWENRPMETLLLSIYRSAMPGLGASKMLFSESFSPPGITERNSAPTTTKRYFKISTIKFYCLWRSQSKKLKMS